MRVLIVDDDEIALELLGEALSGAGYEVTAAHNGARRSKSCARGCIASSSRTGKCRK